jgi:class 3 adenylate cyclase
VARLSARERAALPDKAFAYLDSTGARRLPIHDEAHVRNALSRFDRVQFESDDAKDRARQRLLNAAKRFGIMPIGFVSSQLRSARTGAPLPTGLVTFLLTDIEGSTKLLRQLDADYALVLRDLRRLISDAVRSEGGHRVDAYGDGHFSVFANAGAALQTAIAVQRAVAVRSWPGGVTVRVRAGLHTGRPTLSDGAYVGLSVHTVARICSVAHGGQVVVSGQTSTAIEVMPDGVEFLDLGSYRLAGLGRDEQLFQVVAPGLGTDFPPLRILP